MSKDQSKSRRAARESAFQAAYQCFVGKVSVDRAVEQAVARGDYSEETSALVKNLASGALTRPQDLDAKISPFLRSDWTIDRIAVCELLILRMATYELFSEDSAPPKVVVSEAVRIAKKYGAAESGSFINGVLANLIQDITD